MEEKTLLVCERCLWAIESREGKQMTIKHYIDPEDEEEQQHHCDWCGNEENYVLYELI
jgi:hypothetical protein